MDAGAYKASFSPPRRPLTHASCAILIHLLQVDAGAYKAFRQPTLRPEDGGIAVRLAFIFTVCVPVPDPRPPAPVPPAPTGPAGPCVAAGLAAPHALCPDPFHRYADAPFVERLFARLYSERHYYLFHVDPAGASAEFEKGMRILCAKYANVFISKVKQPPGCEGPIKAPL